MSNPMDRLRPRDRQVRSRRALRRARPEVEAMEPRLVLSLIFGPEDAQAEAAGLASAEARRHGPVISTGPAIRLDLVALHELGHSLGLDDSSDPNSIMYPYYNANYDLNTFNFAHDSAVATLQALYTNVNTSPWKDSRDPQPGDGTVEITYSFMPDGTRLDQGQNTLFSTFNALYGAGTWESIFRDELTRWATVSGGKIAFEEHGDVGLPFNYRGSAQNDPRSGDIRIGAHSFDGPSNVLAHTYFPPPNGATAAGDAHFDMAENWGGHRSARLTSGNGSSRLASGGVTPGAAPIVAMAPARSASNQLASVASPTDVAPEVIIPARPRSVADGGLFGHRPFERFS